MTRAELLEIIANGENSGAEFKQDALQTFDLAKELVAFSNLRGGAVLLGVDDAGGITGIQRPDLEEWVMSVCRDKVRPPLIPFFEVIRDMEPGKHMAIVSVAKGFDVHSVWHHSGSRYYVRVGSQSREASTEELRRLFQQRGAIRAEAQTVSGARFGDLDQRRLRNYLEQIRRQDTPADTDTQGWELLLRNTELMTDEGITVAATLLFGRDSKRFLPQSGIQAVAYTGTEKDYAVHERSDLRGPLTPLLKSNGELAEPGLIEEAIYFIRRNTPVSAHLEDGIRRVERLAYPPEVLREAIVNALIHRDYLLSSTDVELSIYSNRLEIISPGRLPNGITPERMRTGCRAARNELLKDVMRDYGYLEHMGMGVPRQIIQGMRAHNNTEPDLIEDGERFLVRLWT